MIVRIDPSLGSHYTVLKDCEFHFELRATRVRLHNKVVSTPDMCAVSRVRALETGETGERVRPAAPNGEDPLVTSLLIRRNSGQLEFVNVNSRPLGTIFYMLQTRVSRVVKHLQTTEKSLMQ